MGDLERPQQALVKQLVRLKAGNVLAIQIDATGRRVIGSRNAVEERRFTGSVGTDQARQCSPPGRLLRYL